MNKFIKYWSYLVECEDKEKSFESYLGDEDINGNSETVTIGGKNFTVKNGDIDCYNKELTSLKGAPQEVKGDFKCNWNKLTSLEGAPKKVGGNINCSDNYLTSLNGAPQEVGGRFICAYNRLTSLEGAPWIVDGDVVCNDTRIPEYKIDAYKAFLKLSDSEKAPLTKDNHYYPTEEWENKFK